MIMNGAVPTGVVLGIGAYGHVLELEYQQHLYAGKVFRKDAACSQSSTNFCKMFLKEYGILAKLKYPNIVRYHGLCFLSHMSEFPVLVMERMECSLEEYLLRPDRLDQRKKLLLLHGVAKGLVYLHNQAVIHRDLTAKNVLLDKNNDPKISDFGNSRMFKNDPCTQLNTITQCPGTLLYMPPEALSNNRRIDASKLDIFAFGHLALFTSTQVFPDELDEATYIDEESGLLMARSEVERRERYFQEFGTDHPAEVIELIELIKHCLANATKSRPSAVQVQACLENIKEKTN